MMSFCLVIDLVSPAPDKICAHFIKNNRLSFFQYFFKLVDSAGRLLHQTWQIIKGKQAYWRICQLGQSRAAVSLCVYVKRQGEEINGMRASERGKGIVVTYTINPYWLKHHRKLFTVGVCHITLSVLMPEVVGCFDWSSNVNYPAVWEYVRCVCGVAMVGL